MDDQTLLGGGVPSGETSAVQLPELISKKRRIVYEKGAPPFNSADTMHSFHFIIRGKIKI